MKSTKKYLILILAIIAIFTISGCISTGEDLLSSGPVTASRTDLTVTITADGTIRSNQTTYLLWQTSGLINEIYVNEGALVETDELLGDLVLTTLPQHIILAEAQLASAETARDSIEDLYGPAAIASAERAVAIAEEAVADTRNRYNAVANPASQTDIDTTYANLKLAEKQLDDVRDANANTISFLTQFGGGVTKTVQAQLDSSESAALERYNTALKKYEDLVRGQDPDDIALAEANYKLAQNQLIEAQEELARIQAGPDETELAAADARVDAAASTITLSQIRAPFPGTITQSNLLPGDQVNPGSIAFRLDDLSGLFIDVLVSETDINRVEIGQEAIIKADAAPNTTFTGKITEISPVGESYAGVVTFNVEIEIIDTSDRLRPGMSADISIVIEAIENALVVPSSAIRLFEGERVVYIEDAKGKPTPVVVELGRTVDGFVHIVSGDLQEGDIVIVDYQE